MNKNQYEPIDEYERNLMKSIENDEFFSIEPQSNKQLQSDAVKRADSALKKDKRMNIRISERDLRNLKIRALEEGLPYQTLVSMVLHKYLSGKIKETV